MHALLITMGTHGDVAPYLALGQRLRARGHRVTLVANEAYQTAAAAQGCDFRTLISTSDLDRILSDPDFWHPVKAPLVGVRHGRPLIAAQYDLIAELAQDDSAVLVANPGVFAARLAHDKLQRPLASLVLQPWMIPSCLAPPVMPFGLTLPRWAPRWCGHLYWWAIDRTADRLVAGEINRLRRALDLPPIRRVPRWWVSPDLIIGMFPEWYGPPQPDWPPQVRLAGFPLDDGVPAGSLPDDVRAFCQRGPAPIAFTLGTGMMHADEFFRAAVAACRELDRPGLLLTRYPQQLPPDLPPNVRHCAFTPFLELLPLCAAVVHHGGVGSTAKALATGTPQVLLPLAWDQPDNASRVVRLGVGTSLPARRRSGRDLARALTAVLAPEVRDRCRAVAARFVSEDALTQVAQWIEELAARHGVRCATTGCADL